MKKLYRPSNGTEGIGFMEDFCFQCIHENPNPNLKPKCGLMTASMVCGVNDPLYPQEWTYDQNDRPTCTKFTKWDWGNDGDPNDPDKPKAPVPEDPNQLCFPFIYDELEIELKPHLIEQ